MNASEYRKLLKNDPSGGYIFFGEEEYMKYFCYTETKNIISANQSEAAFSIKRYSAEKIDDFISSLSDIYDYIITPSMFFEYKLVSVHDLDAKQIKEADLNTICETLSAICKIGFEKCILIFYMKADSYDSGTLKKPSKIHENLCKYLTPVEFPKESVQKLISWVNKHFTSQNINIEINLCEMLIDRCKSSMTLLSNEISKLCSYVLAQNRNEILRDDIENVTVLVDDFEEFAISEAVMNGKKTEVYKILNDLKMNKNSFAAANKPEVILASISRIFCDMIQIKILSEAGMTANDISVKTGIHQYRVGLYLNSLKKYEEKHIYKIIKLCDETDIKIKSSGLENSMLIDRLVALL